MKQCSAEAGALIFVCVHVSGHVQLWRCLFACWRLLYLLADSPFLGPCLRAEFLVVPQMHHILSWISDFMHFLKCLPPHQFSWNTEDPITIRAIISGGSFPSIPLLFHQIALVVFLFMLLSWQLTQWIVVYLLTYHFFSCRWVILI